MALVMRGAVASAGATLMFDARRGSTAAQQALQER